MEKMPSMKIRKNNVTKFMKKYNIAIPEPMPTKPVLLRLIREANVWKQYIIDKIAKTSVCSILWLPSYHCMLNHIEIVLNSKQHCRQQNIYTYEPSKVLDLICGTTFSPKYWESFV